MSLEVSAPGLLTTVQDAGRVGYRRYGVICSGVMDDYAFRYANLLLGNAEQCPVLEATLQGPELIFHAPTVICLCGAEFDVRLNRQEICLWRPVVVKAGDKLDFGKAKKGSRIYLAIKNGFVVPAVMGSGSTYLRANIGGYQGRALQCGDCLEYTATDCSGVDIQSIVQAIGTDLDNYCEGRQAIRFIRSNQWDWFSEAVTDQFINCEYRVSPSSDRMAYRLDGEILQRDEMRELITEGVCPGTVQIPTDGMPIVLMADCQTTGGYPKIVQVISVDLPRLAQLKPGDTICFMETDLVTAQQLLRQQHHRVEKLREEIMSYWQKLEE